MTPAEAATLQGLLVAYDNRKPSEMVAREWAQVLGDVPLADAIEAVREHCLTSTEYLTVAHIRRGVKRIRDRRIEAAGVVEPPPVDPDDTAAYLAELRRSTRVIASGDVPVSRPALVSAPRTVDYRHAFRDAS